MRVILGLTKHHYMARASIFLITAALVWAILGATCPEPYEYELKISSTGGGNVTIPGEGTFTYGAGTSHALLATPDEGYRFVNWYGDVGNIADRNAAGTTIKLDGSYSITANFTEILEYHLTVSTTVGGWVITPGVGTFPYAGGTVVNLVAHEDVGYGFVNWTGDVSAIADRSAATTTITMSGNYSITANFEKEKAVTITDPNLEAAIREEIDIPEDTIYPSDLKKIEKLEAYGQGITELTGLEHCTGLTRLYLYDNQISDISAVANLTSLKELYLSGNQISDISPLANLTSLKELYLSGNQISDISPLVNLTSLGELYLSGNRISNISPLSNLTSLSYLSLGGNQISNISALASLTSLRELYLSGNQISNISPLSNLTSLSYLSLGGNQISNISALASLTSLRELYLSGNQISNISALASLTSLTDLSLGGNQISGVSPLANITSLTLLNLSDNQISDIKPLVDNPGLSQGDKVYLSNNPLSSSSTSNYIPRLEARGVIVEY
jgi:Leucine-rich repeat (LRR) protein